MDTVPLVEYRIDAGQKLLDRLADEGFVVRAACWLRRAEEDRWSLFIATPAVDETDSLDAYRRLRPIRQSLGDDWITGSDVTLVGEKHSLVQYAIDILRRFPHKAPIQSPRSLGEGIFVEEVYVYPLGKTTVKIYRLVFPEVPVAPEILSLEPLSNGRVFVKWEGKDHPGKTEEWEVAAPEGATLERDKTGQMVLAWWDLHGKRRQSSAKDVWKRAEDVQYGFRSLREPSFAK